MGDRYQLKPVNHKIGDEIPLFTFIKNHNDYNIIILDKMTELMRCTDKLSYYYKFFIDIFEGKLSMQQLKRAYPYSSKDECIKHNFMSVYDVDRSIIISYSNEYKNYYNKTIKENLECEQYNCTVEEFVSGFYFNVCDRVMLDNHVNIYQYKLRNDTLTISTDRYKYTLYSGEMYFIDSIKPIRINLPESIKFIVDVGYVDGYYIGLSNKVHLPIITHKTRSILVHRINLMMALIFVKREQYKENIVMKQHGRVHDALKELFGSNTYDDLRKLQKGITYRDLKKSLSTVDRQLGTLFHAYAITLYKSQGSTYKHVLIDIKDINRCCYEIVRGSEQEKNESYYSALYVAVTRAAEGIHYLT